MSDDRSHRDQTARDGAARGGEGPEPSREGWVPDLADPEDLCRALDEAFDYRGDVTLTLKDGREIEGYVFDRRRGRGLDDSVVRIIPTNRSERLEVPYGRIARLAFTGKDTAHGRSFETWIRKYVQKKLRGERADIEDPAGGS